ncbi:peptide ABC transporter substrate-binding protein [Bacillus haynesii]|nr:peptide ABC transporter substrate-binding protein [Bacillus haynesii]UIN47474.1 peptide ABC transporter substrate-binding protein [Bacillus licheniformis]MCY7801075.1 peptide ABC transporter substrate-binding protein [Bacillus haynesii]MCY7836541.1 peptide ABC transporter substrate-binding protein [Bacillus haynesii]MCY7966496.1 peptide ABC transporter substrate-binding protein [Bacillus haynesii]MCY8091263.1 peptide ABC transporter substrate-binding protein [Bacillus haynesii]
MKRLASVLAAAFAIILLFGCTANEQAGQETKKKAKETAGEQVLRLNNENEPTSFDPPIGFNNVSWQALNNLMEGLTRLGADHEPEAASAEKWNISDDGKTYTFTIRDDAKWSNGDPLTAGDFEYAWKRLLDPKTGSSAAFLGYFIEGGEAFNSGKGAKDDVKVKAVDEKTLKVTLESPQQSFLSIVANPAFFPVPQKVAEKNPKWHEEAATFVGNGPFKLTEWKHDESFTMVKSDTYWDRDTVKLDKVIWAMVDDRNTDYQMFESNELDTAYVPAEMSEKLMGADEVKVFDQAGLYYYRFNVNKEPFQNEKIRKAFAMAVDQQEIVDYVTKNGEKPARGFVSPGIKGPNGKDFREEGGDLLKYDADEAKQLLEKGMKEENYEKLPAVTLTYSTKPEHKKMAEAIQQKLKSTLGVDVKLANMEWNTFLEEQKALKFQFSQSSFLADYADPINFLESFQTGNAMNRTGWSNSEYDELIKAAKNEADEEKRTELLHQAEELLFEGMPIIPIHFYNQVHLEKENVKGIVRHPVGYIELKWAEKTS